MNSCVVTGSGGLIGSQAVQDLSGKFDTIIGIDNNKRAEFFGGSASINPSILQLNENVKNYDHNEFDIRGTGAEGLFKVWNQNIKLIIHTASQPSHDWASSNPIEDFEINALGTLKLLEHARKYCPDAVFIFCSTNKVYGDAPNYNANFVELPTSYERRSVPDARIYVDGFDETLSIDQNIHSLFGCSKASADLYVQEYGKYFGMKTGCFRMGCITGKNHRGAEQHGFLSYLFKCGQEERPYTIYGYQGKQVRDNLHAKDVITAFYAFYKNPKQGAVYNLGGGISNSCSVLEAIQAFQEHTKKKMIIKYNEQARRGDHIWYVTDNSKFQKDYPDWKITIPLEDIFKDLKL